MTKASSPRKRPKITRYTTLIIQATRDRDIRLLTARLLDHFGGIDGLYRAWLDHIKEYPEFAGRSFACIARLKQHSDTYPPDTSNISSADLLRQIEKLSNNPETS